MTHRLKSKQNLIFGTCYVETQEQRYVFGLWRDLVEQLNPWDDILIVDSASPALPDTGRAEVLQLGNNIGHLMKNGRDGWGRAFCAGLAYAVEHDYRNVVHIETDLLFAKPVGDVLKKMVPKGVRIMAPWAFPYQFIETALMFIDVNHIKFRDLIARYDWKKSVPTEYPEVKIQKMIDEHLFVAPLRGMRDDLKQLTASNIRKMFPFGIDWITHADPDTYRAFLEVNRLG